jgi:dolichol-phosphate mannosyltransferase
MVKLAFDGILSFSTEPLRLVSLAGIASASLALLGICYALCVRLFTSLWVSGWTSLFIGMLFLGGLQLPSLGIVGEYIGRVYTEAKGRPLFLVQEVLPYQFLHAAISEAQPPMRRPQPANILRALLGVAVTRRKLVWV